MTKHPQSKIERLKIEKKKNEKRQKEIKEDTGRFRRAAKEREKAKETEDALREFGIHNP